MKPWRRASNSNLNYRMEILQTTEEEDVDNPDIYKESGSRRTVIISAIDKCEANRNNMELVLEPVAPLLVSSIRGAAPEICFMVSGP